MRPSLHILTLKSALPWATIHVIIVLEDNISNL